MSSKQHTNTPKSSDDFFRLKPLVAGIKVVIAGGLFVGSSMAQVSAEPLPVPVITGPIITDGNADHGIASLAINGQQATITQTTNQAIIDWKSFDIAKGYGVNFVQPSASAAALNNIHDANATQILGSLTANGQVYLVNNNGFVFGKDSVVDANAILASALNISDANFNGGIIRTFDNNVLKPAAALSGGATTNAAIEVEAGARIHVGPKGSVILAAPTVTNSGSITAEQNGQILLVASQDAVYLQPASSSSPFAGLLVEVGKGGTVNNKAGANVAVREGNITLAGFAVNQSGRLSATTSVNTNGSIRLLAREAVKVAGGNRAFPLSATQTVRDAGSANEQNSLVTFGAASATVVLADANGGSAIDEQAQKQSYVEVSADKIAMKSGSAIVATSGAVKLQATNNLKDPLNALSTKLGNRGRIDLEQGATIDVSGSTNTKVAMARNVAAVSVQSFNLRDAPYQKGGVLQGATVQVDVRNLPTIVDASSAPASITRSIDERLSAGGAINLVSGGDVLVNSGAVTNIAGGSVSYQGGLINSTQLVNAATGQVVDISKADPNQQYSSIYGVYTQNYAKWGVKESWNISIPNNSGQYEAGYTQGKAAGELNITSPNTAWAGTLVAGTVSDIYQRGAPAFGGSFSFNQGDIAPVFVSSQNIVFQKHAPKLAIGIDEVNTNTDLILATDFVKNSGISKLTIKTAGNATLANDANLVMPMLSNLGIVAANIKVLGSIYSPGGNINLTALANPIDSSSGQINLLTNSELNVSGRWVNDFKEGISSPLAINAGSVTLESDRQINFNNAATIKADGGAQFNLAGNKVTGGNAGAINLQTSAISFADGMQRGVLSAKGLNQGGTLNLAVDNNIIIGGAASDTSALNLGVSHGILDLAANAGFSNISLESNYQDITVAANTNWSFITQNSWLNADFRTQTGSSSLAGFSQVTTLPENSRKPVSLSLTGQTGVSLETGSEIQVDKASTVTLTAKNAGTGLYINGLIDALGGTINLNLKADMASLAYDNTQAIWLGPQASLNTHGSVLVNPVDALGRQSGLVLNGGNVNIKANRGYVIFAQGSQVNVDGTSASLDIPSLNTLQTSKQLIGSDAGQINISAAEGIVVDGTLSAQKGLASNRGGELSISLDRSNRSASGTSFPQNKLHIDVVHQDTITLTDNMAFGANLDALNGLARISSKQIRQAGIDSLRLALPYNSDYDQETGLYNQPGEINFIGDVSLTAASSIILDAPSIGSVVNNAGTGVVGLNTGYLQIGSTTVDNVTSATYGNVSQTSLLGAGNLTANANYIQLQGSSLLTGFNNINLNSLHDMRAVGILSPNAQVTAAKTLIGGLSTKANLTLNASQIYPSSATQFTFDSSQLTILGHNTDVTPLSANGALTFNAATINQEGILKAPLGSIALNADNSLVFGGNSYTSVSAEGLIIPFGRVANNVWSYAFGGAGNLVFNSSPKNNALGVKTVAFTSPSIHFAKGSVVNVSGGGDLMTATFQPGAGGSYDYLRPSSASYQGGFAIMPALGAKALAPYDINLLATMPKINGLADPRADVYLNGTADLAAGFYTILPAYYALLPGAFLVTPQSNTLGQTLTTYSTDGLPIVAGYQSVAGTNIQASLNSGYLIETSAQVQMHSQYLQNTANTFFTQQAAANGRSLPLLPEDSGQISIIASTSLVLDGQFNTLAVNGRGAAMDISATNIDIVNSLSNASTNLQLLAKDLNNLHVDSLLLGGRRVFNNATGGTQLDVKAAKVLFDEGVQVQALDLIAVAKNKVEVKSGASITSTGLVNTGASVFNLKGDSAFLRVSADKQAQVNRSGASGLAGSLFIDQGATLKASKSMVLDASLSTLMNGDIIMSGGSVNMTANQINLGEVTGITGNALNLTNQNLAGLVGNDVTLTSHNAINFYGDIGQLDANNKLTAIQFNHLVLDASSLSGYAGASLNGANSGNFAMLQANTIALQNSSGNTATQVGTGTGVLDLSATQFNFAKGAIALDGFTSANINVDKQMSVTGKSVLKVASDLNITTGLITASGGNSLLVDASGHSVNIYGKSNNIPVTANQFGASIAVTANTISLQDAKVLLPSGTLTLNALAGDVLINGATHINLAGQAVNFADVVSYTPGGTFSASANKGGLVLGSDSILDINTGGGNATGGSLSLAASSSTVNLAGTLKANGANASLDVAGFSSAQGFDSLMNKLMAAGVNQALYVRSRVSDIVQTAGNIITAKTISLVADSKSINISGKLVTDNKLANAGDINLYAANNIKLESGSKLSARGVTGGKVLLSALGTNTVQGGTISLLTGSNIDVTGSSSLAATNSAGGKVSLSALRTNSTGINIAPIAGTVSGASQLNAVGYQKYDASSVSTDIFGLATTINSDINTYMTNASAITTGLGGFTLRPGVEIDNASGPMTLATAWDFSELSNRTSPIVGDLIVRSAGQINMNASLTDGYVGTTLMNTDSWSFQLVSGADLSSADTMATSSLSAADKLNNPTMSDLTIGSVLSPNVSIHTGTGNIELGAGGNMVLTDQTDTVYSGGRSTTTNPYGTYDGIQKGTGLLAQRGALYANFSGAYPISGGDIVLRAGGNIIGAASYQFNQGDNSWLGVQGNAYNAALYINMLTAWGVDASKFQQNIGSFGGGSVNVSAAGNINDLSVMMPTTGKQLGTDYSNIALDIQGGGQMTVAAAGNISGGAYFLGKGDGSISAGGQIDGSHSTDPNAFVLGPQLVMSGNQADPIAGNTKLSLNANQGVAISGVSDAMVLNYGGTQFFTYTDKSQLTLNSLAGNVTLNSNTDVITNILYLETRLGAKNLPNVYPTSLDATAFNGSVVLANDIILFPSSVANVNILAQQSITSDKGLYSLTMSDADPSLIAKALSPVILGIDPSYDIFDTAAINVGNASVLTHAYTPLHNNDKTPARFVTQLGDISSVQFNVPKQAIIEAGNDLLNSSILIQQINAGDASIISAGRDIKYELALVSDGSNYDGTPDNIINKKYQINIAGPGNALLKTGRNLDLGASVGLTSVGNLFNPALANSGANLDILVGLKGGTPDYVAFIDKYLMTNQLYVKEYAQLTALITPFMQQESANVYLTDAQALSAFAALTPVQTLAIQPQLNAILTPVFFNELQLAGTASAADKTKGNAGGFAAIATLFPNNEWQGDLTMPFSKIQTISGGDINLFVPGGQVNAGLAIAPSGAGAKKASELGIVAQTQGAINAYVKHDFTVNTSRVFTLGGGDIVIWSSEGNIDAGKGAKSALAVTVDPPYFDPKTNQLVVPAPKITSGSGIRAASAPGQLAGNVSLFAPGGIVDAGEAGIGGNNVTISATAVMGGNNIQVGGTSTGVPQASSGSMAAGLTGASNLTANVSQVGQALAGVDDKESQNSKNNTLSMLSVEVLGFGD